MHVETKELPETLQRALESVSYHCRDISIESAETFSPAGAGGDGYQAFVAIVDLDTGRIKTTRGSWGGANMFNPRNPVDLDTRSYPIPPNVAVISGSRGGTSRSTYASITVSPQTIAPLLPKTESISDIDAGILYCYNCIKGGQYRRDELARLGVDTDPHIENLIARGFLKRNKAGATQITTAGKNAYSQSGHRG